MIADDSVCAVVVTYNRKDLLRLCLRSLLAQSHSLDEIIVVDNASTDGTDLIIAEEFPQINYQRLSENGGGAGGFHFGMKLSFERGHEWIWVMDDDAVPTEGALERMIEAVSICKDSPRTGVAIPMTTSGHETPAFAGGMFSRRAIQQCGLPNREFFIDLDDIEFCLRIEEAGLATLRVPDRIINHEHCGSLPSSSIRILGKTVTRPQIPDFRAYYQIRNRLLCFIDPRRGRFRVGSALIATAKDLFAYAVLRDWRKLQFASLGAAHGLLRLDGKRVEPSADTLFKFRTWKKLSSERKT